MINVEAGRLREPAAWLMIAVASTGVLVGVEQLLFGTSSGGSFAFRAANQVGGFTSPVTAALLVGAVLLAGHAGPAIERLKLMVQVAVGTLGLAALFGTVGLFGGLFAGETGLWQKIEFLVLSLPALALTGIALAYLVPKAAGSAGASGAKGGARLPHGVIFPDPRLQEQYAAPQGGPAGPQGGQVPHQGIHPQEQAPQHGFHPQEQPGFHTQEPQGFHSQEQSSQHGFPQHDQAAPQQGFQHQEPQGFHSQEQPSQHGFPQHDHAPQQGFQHQDQGAHAYQQAQPAPVVQLPYSPPALPPAPSSSSGPAGASEEYGQAHGYVTPLSDAYPQSSPAAASHASPQPYAQQGGGQSYGTQSSSYGQPGSQSPADAYTPSPYVPADVQPSAQARSYDSPAAYETPGTAYDPAPTAYDTPPTAYDPPVYAAPVEQPQASVYGDAHSSGYTDPQLPGYAPPAEPQASGYAPQPHQVPQPEQQGSFYGTQPEVASPYGSSDSQPRLSFDTQGQQSFPQPPDNYGQPFTGFSGAEYARQTEPNLHYPAPAPDPVDPHSQQMAQAYQQAQSYQQQAQGMSQPGVSQGTEPQLRIPEYTSQVGGSYDDPFGQSQGAPQTPPAQPYQQGGGQQWETPAETTLRFDPAAYQGDPLSGPSPAAQRSWDPQPIDPTAIYKPERSAQVTGEEIPDRERVGPGQEQNMSWYGSDRREH
ncbi:hypothetical protein AB0395_18775 [Streptosporangium sp. NPDC051023]|uniref:hypothetical protein n=1 Tax=Streptosporangium sp. NPDC051023 TaxID=3155410 RepID=UPI00344BFBAD